MYKNFLKRVTTLEHEKFVSPTNEPTPKKAVCIKKRLLENQNPKLNLKIHTNLVTNK